MLRSTYPRTTIDTLAHIHEALGRTIEALVEYKKALALNPAQTESKEGLERLTASGTGNNTKAK